MEYRPATKKLILSVKKNSFLFDRSHEDYKNVVRKAEAWNDIAGDLGITCDLAKQKWKNLRDSYIRYQKCLLKGGAASKKYNKWPWSRYMTFLDSALYLRRPISMHQPSVQDSEGTQVAELKTKPAATLNLQDTRPHITLLTYTKKLNPQCEDPVHKSEPRKLDRRTTVIESKKPKELDGIDHLFLSYAETFRKLNSRTQVLLKIELATLFARIEMDELNGQTTFSKEPASSPPRSPYSDPNMAAIAEPACLLSVAAPSISLPLTKPCPNCRPTWQQTGSTDVGDPSGQPHYRRTYYKFGYPNSGTVGSPHEGEDRAMVGWGRQKADSLDTAVNSEEVT